MNTSLFPSPSPSIFASPNLSKTYTSFSPLFSNILVPSSSSKSICIQFSTKRDFQATGFRCNNCFFPGGPPSGDGDSSSKNVLDAFFLGKALAETLNERIESTVGEFLSTVGRLQAEQQRQVQEFQEEVLDRAKKEKEKAAREAMEAQGLISKSAADTVVVYSATSVQSTDVSATNIDPTKGGDTTLSSS